MNPTSDGFPAVVGSTSRKKMSQISREQAKINKLQEYMKSTGGQITNVKLKICLDHTNIKVTKHKSVQDKP